MIERRNTGIVKTGFVGMSVKLCTHTHGYAPFEVLAATDQMRDLAGDVGRKRPPVDLDPLPDFFVATLRSEIPRYGNGEALQRVLHLGYSIFDQTVISKLRGR